MPPRKPRLSLTKTQIQAGIGAELLALCQGITSDGVLTDAEIAELRAWLAANRSADLPAIAFLVTTLERILADGKVTEDERRELHGAIETVLPPEARKTAVSRRRAVEAEQKAHERAEAERSRPVHSLNFMVAGVHYEGRPEVIRKFVNEGDTVILARDPHNEFSANAIEVRVKNGMQIGFVPETEAPDAAPFLDKGCPHVAYVTKLLRGGRVPIPVVQAYMYRPDSGVGGLVFPASVPAKRPHTLPWPEGTRERHEDVAAAGSKPGCLGTFLVVAAAMLLIRACGQ